MEAGTGLRACNPEMYFTAETRMKYAATSKKDYVMNDMRKAKKTTKPKKGERGTGGRKATLPQKPTFTFSVTQVASQAATENPSLEFDTSKHAKESGLLENRLKSDFPKWLYLMREGFSIMLYGYGSKLPVLQSFKDFLSDDFLTISINGLYPKLNARKFLIGFCEAMKLDKVAGANLEIISESVFHELKNRSDVKTCRDVFLLVKNFETLAVRHPTMLTTLSWLSKASFVHLIASSDNINPFLGINQTQTIDFNFAWVDSTNFYPYDQELVWKPEVFGSHKEANSGINSLEHIMKSLTANARKAFSILATLQLAKLKEMDKSKVKEFQGVEFRELARRCREGFIAHSDATLKTLLIEFIDHKLIRRSGTKKFDDFLNILLDVETLEKVIKLI